MGKLLAFNNITLDGYFTGANGDMSWAHRPSDDKEWNEFVSGNAKGGGTLLFGRITYQMMAGYWPTPLAAQNDPVVAERMNSMQKIVVSDTLDKVDWENTTLIKGDLIKAVQQLKKEPENHITILGSGTIIAQLSKAGLIDEYQMVVNPVTLGSGRTMFDSQVSMKLTKTRAFGNGNVLLCYEAVR